LLIFLQVTIDNVGDFFPGFLFISTHISLDLFSLGSAKAYIGWGGKLNSRLIASCVTNIHTKNYQNLIIGFQVIVKNGGDVFLRYSVYSYKYFFAYISLICREAPLGQIYIKFCMRQPRQFFVNQIKSFDSVGGRIFGFPIGKRSRR